MSELTQIFAALQQGEPVATDRLLPLVYEELRLLARQKLAREPEGTSLQATALVHEAYLRLLGGDQDPATWNSRGHFFAAAAEGLWISTDGGGSWTTETEGLHARYCRAVAVTGETVFVSASTGPGGRRAALYRREPGGGRLERCRDGLPEWFGDNLDTHCLAVSGPVVVLGTENGVVHASADGGRTFSVLAKGLPPVRAVVLR